MIEYTHVAGDQYDAHVNGQTVQVTRSRERGYPWMPGAPNNGRPHLAMYEAAVQFLGKEPLRVLDFACGSGYGTAALRAAGHTVIGADCSDEAIAFARAAYGGEFVVADIGSTWPWRTGSFDAVVCVESIEHTTHDASALAEARRVVRPGGTLILSTPQGSPHKPMSPHHVHEYTMMELATLLERTGWGAQMWVPSDAWLVLARRDER